MKKIDFSFIVHSRDRTDLPRKFPVLKYIPRNLFDWLTLSLKPFVVSKITGVKSISNGNNLNGEVIGISMTAHQLLENRSLALQRIIEAVKLSKKRGAKYVALGAMTASLSKGGRDVIDKIPDVYITTGRTYTVKNITDYIEFCIKEFSLNKETLKVGIVGAAGGIGSGVAISLARIGLKKFTLIDLERKIENVRKNIIFLENNAKDLEICVSHKLSDVTPCKIIVAATSSPEIVLKSTDIEPGTIIINDAQPSDIDPEIIKNRKDVIVIEGGVLHTDNINCHFNFGLKHKNDVFSCLGEAILLSSLGFEGHSSIEGFDQILYKKLSETSNKLGFSICPQNVHAVIDQERITGFKSCI
jgi:predicted amino acid dehydrogenase